MELLKRHRYLLALLAVMILHIVLRVRFLNHQLILDEGNNYICLQSLNGLYPGLNFNQVLRYHPPLYLLVANFLSTITGQRHMSFYESYSILLSALTLIPLYLLGREVRSRRTGLLACFAYAVMPAAMVMDTWIKVDPMEVLFVVLFVYLLVKRKAAWAGMALGLAMLSKETAAFIVLAFFAYLLVTKDRERIRPFIYAVLIGAALSFWWYLFISLTRGRFLEFLLGTHPEVAMFDFGVFYYFKGLGRDLGPFLILAAVAGAASGTARFIRRGRKLDFLPLACSLTPYLFFLVLKGKPPWIITTVLPFIALLAGQGMDAFLRLMREKGRAMAAFAAAMLLLAGIVTSVAMSYDGYMRSRQGAIYSYSQDLRGEAETIGGMLEPDEPLLAYFGAGTFPNAIFLTYVGERPVLVMEEGINALEIAETVQQNGIEHAAVYNDTAGNALALYMMVEMGFRFSWHAAIPFTYRDVTVDIQPEEVMPLRYFLFGEGEPVSR